MRQQVPREVIQGQAASCAQHLVLVRRVAGSGYGRVVRARVNRDGRGDVMRIRSRRVVQSASQRHRAGYRGGGDGEGRAPS